MRNIILIIGVFVSMVSCGSNDDDTRIDNSELIGKWNWISSCGGIVDGCWYPSEDNYETVEFTNNLYIRKMNGVIIETEINYSITGSFLSGTDLIYIIEFQNGNIMRFMFIDDNLSIEGGDFWRDYERIELE